MFAVLGEAIGSPKDELLEALVQRAMAAMTVGTPGEAASAFGAPIFFCFCFSLNLYVLYVLFGVLFGAFLSVLWCLVVLV